MKPEVMMSVRQPARGTAVIEIRGEVTAQAEKSLDTVFAQAQDLGAHHIVLDFSGMTYMNSNGLGLFVKLLARANQRRQRLLAVGLNDHYRRIFKVTRLEESIPLFESETQAVAALRGDS